jgi:hypothetical protein
MLVDCPREAKREPRVVEIAVEVADGDEPGRGQACESSRKSRGQWCTGC